MSLIYYFDIGNSRGKFWRCKNGQVEGFVALSHQGGYLDGLVFQLPDEFSDIPDKVFGASVLSESENARLASAASSRWQRPPVFAKSSASFKGVFNAYIDNPTQLGIDRWLGVIAASVMADAACVVSCGTALTIDVLKEKRHLGGYILPGLDMMSTALQIETRGIRFNAIPVATLALGKSTAEAVEHGVMAAVVALIERVLVKEGPLRLVLTGGDAPRVSKHLELNHDVEPDLLLHGLQQYFHGLDISN